LSEKLLHSKKQIKPLLLDQSFIAGMGNIYTDEALFTAKIHPLTQANQLDEKDALRLHKAIQVVLLEGIKRNGASIDWVYRGGDFQNYFKVYQRDGEKCVNCGTTIERITVGQRGTHFCPHCQPRIIKR
jgi:formamidopyrimidine-DNA glycosylase